MICKLSFSRVVSLLLSHRDARPQCFQVEVKGVKRVSSQPSPSLLPHTKTFLQDIYAGIKHPCLDFEDPIASLTTFFPSQHAAAFSAALFRRQLTRRHVPNAYLQAQRPRRPSSLRIIITAATNSLQTLLDASPASPRNTAAYPASSTPKAASSDYAIILPPWSRSN